MVLTFIKRVALPFALLAFSTTALAADPVCGLNTGEKASGDPILVGGIYGDGPPGDFSGGTDAAAAYFKCVNDNGGVNGRPIEYLTENDQWNPELAGQVATSLVIDKKVVALVGNGSVVEMAVNAKLYADENVMVMASGCAISECFETSNIVSSNQGPLPSGTGAMKFAIEELGAEHVACIGLNIPNNGGWACDWVGKYMESQGKKSTALLMDPSSLDLNTVFLQALAEGVDTILTMLPSGPILGLLKVAEEQDARDQFNWVSPTPLYDRAVPAALGEYWDGKVYVNIELAPFNSTGPDNVNWKAVVEQYGLKGDAVDTFSQSGFVSAKFFVDTLLQMDPKDINRANVTEAIKGISDLRSDLLCGPYYVGDFDRHMPNHAGRMVVYKDGDFQMVRDCYDIEDSEYLVEIREQERQLGLIE